MVLKAISTQDNDQAKIHDLIFRVSPYSEENKGQFHAIVNKFLADEHYQHMEYTGRTDNKTVPNEVYQQYFFIWRSYDKSKIYAGQLYVSQREVEKGLDLRRLEYYTS